MTAGVRYLVLMAAAAALIAAAVLPAQAAADISVPGWRSFAATGKIEVDPGGGPAPDIRLVSRRSGRAGIDQIVVNPPPTVEVEVTGSVISGEGELLIDWLDAAGEEIETDERSLELDEGVERHSFTSPEGAESMRLAVLQDSGDSILQLESVELLGSQRGALLNPQLRPAGCPTDNTTRVDRYGTLAIPGWTALVEDTAFEILRWRNGRSPPIRIIIPNGQTGIAQYVPAVEGPVTVQIRGLGTSPGAYSVIAWRRPAIRAPADRGLVLVEEERPLDLSDGEDTFVTEPPAVGGPLVLQVSVVENERGALALQSIRTNPEGRELLRNPDLDVSLCPIAPQSPPAVNTIPPGYRWPLTGGLLLVGLGLLVGFWRVPTEEVRPGPEPSPMLRNAFFAAVALTPFVIVGTLKAGLRIIPADWIFLGLAILLLFVARYRAAALSDRARVIAIFSVSVLAVVTALSLAFSYVYWTDENLAGLSVAERLVANIGSPEERGLVDEFHLLQGLAALFTTLALVSTRAMWISTVRVIAVAGAVVGAYGIYQVASQYLLGTVIQPPGAFSPEGLRAAGPFPEPTAYAGFLVFAAACAVALIELQQSRRLALVCFSLILAGAFASRSSIGLAALVVLMGALLLTLRLRTLAWLAVPAILLALTAAFAPGERWKEPLTKPLGISNSVLDREVVWGAAMDMGAAYAPIGVGRGQFAYNQAPFVHPDDADRGGRASSGILELWAESGPLGILFFAAAVLAGPLILLTRRDPPAGSSTTARAVVAVMAVTFIAVMAIYYTSNFAWTWLAVGLLAAAPRAFADPGGVAPTSSDGGASAGEPLGEDDRRVLHVMRMTGVSGAEGHLLELVRVMNGQGWKAGVLIPTPDPAPLGDFADELRAAGAKVDLVPMRRDFSPALLWRLARLLHSGTYTVAHAHLVHADWHLGVAAWFAPGFPIVTSKHNHDPFRRRFGFGLIERATMARYSEVIAISDSLGEFTTRWTGRPTVTVRYGLPSPQEPAAPRDGSPPRLLAVGRLEPQKGFDELIPAMKTVTGVVPDVTLAIAGEGSERGHLERLIGELELGSSVNLLGRREDVPSLMAESTVLVHPARWEGFGLVLLEAMRAGIPIVATKVGAIPEVVEEGSTALLVPPDDPDELAAAILRLLGDPELADSMGRSGFERLGRDFSPERMGREVAQVYERVIRESRS